MPEPHESAAAREMYSMMCDMANRNMIGDLYSNLASKSRQMTGDQYQEVYQLYWRKPVQGVKRLWEDHLQFVPDHPEAADLLMDGKWSESGGWKTYGEFCLGNADLVLAVNVKTMEVELRNGPYIAIGKRTVSEIYEIIKALAGNNVKRLDI